MRSRALLLCLVALSGAARADEPGSGVYAEDCAALDRSFTIDIAADGSATVGTQGVTYSHLRTSQSAFDKETSETSPDFRIAILFGDKASPVPPVEGRPGWIEIWNGESDFYALVNGAADPQLSFCGDLDAFAPAKQTIDCGAAAPGIPQLICETPDLAAADSRLAEAFASAHDNVDAAGLPKLEADQAAWIKQRDACANAADPAACLAPLYRTRLALLSAGYSLATAGATRNYSCKGPVTKLYVVPFDTDPPSVNLMVGKTSIPALLQPNGTSYEAPTGERFRPADKTAELDWPKGQTSTCTAQ